jgi:uncharacterized protein (DUF1015 family)
MEKISLLVFSIENHKEVMQLVDDLYETVDDIVIVDGSSRANHKKLLGIKKNRRLDKIRIFQTVALGYAEPFRINAGATGFFFWTLTRDYPMT